MKSNTTNHRSLFLADESHDESSDEQAQGCHRTGQRTKHARRSLDDVNKDDVAGKTVPAPATGVKSVAGGGPVDAAASGPFPATAGSSPAAAAAGSSPAAAAAGSSPAAAAAGSSPVAAAVGSSPAAAAAGPSRSAIPDGGSPPTDVAPDAVVPAGTPSAVEATGRAYATDAARFDEEARAEPDVNEELRTKAEAQKAIAGVYQKENGRLAEDLKSALVVITHLAKKTTQVDQSTLDWKVRVCISLPIVTQLHSS
ncbi:unnamed protein product [Closterium sp. Naga37s-1]|nr:unnamed protein product [Closterium sp. Naga37s-1]